MNKRLLFLIAATFFTLYSFAQANGDSLAKEAAKTEIWSPEPPVVTPGATCGEAPSDAIILFNGDNLNNWLSVNDSTKEATWNVENGIITVNKKAGDIQTKQKFLDYQLHLEFRIPENIQGTSQARGNSGIFLASSGPGEEGYELQVLDNYNNKTYVNGQVGSIYKQGIPMANPSRKPGEWQVYDVIWTAPRFNSDGSLKSPGRVTAMLNSVIVQNNFEVKGVTQWIGKPYYKAHGASPIKLQAHGDESIPISYRNIWVRNL